MNIKFTSSTYPDGIEYEVLTGSTTGVTFLPVRTIDYFADDAKNKLEKDIQDFWKLYRLNERFKLVKPRKNNNGFS